MRKLKNTRGITLIALVVTIVVLLILAAVSISMLTGENGIITQAIKSQDETEQAKVQEIVDLAVNTLISENMGSKDGITPKDIADKINEEYSQYENVYAEDEANFPTKIIFPEEGDREVEVDLGLSTGNLDEIYDADVSEEDIAPTDIFNYEIISDAETGATSLDSLPTKEARITGIKPEYCNGITNGGYNSETGEAYENTNYEITLKDGTKIIDTLVVPYQVEIDGEMYKITEANIRAEGNVFEEDGYSIPKVKTIIYPNTIEKIQSYYTSNSKYFNNVMTKIILSNNLNVIGQHSFWGCSGLTSIEIPSSVTNIEDYAFYKCDNLVTINYQGTKVQWQQINIGSNNTSLANAQIVCTDGTINQ